MTENTTTSVELVEGQIDLFTGEVVEIEEVDETISIEDVISEIRDTVFKGESTITAYKIHNIINGTFKVLGVDKVVPPQMMYNYSKNGMISGIKLQKQYNKDEVTKFVTKYVTKHSN